MVNALVLVPGRRARRGNCRWSPLDVTLRSVNGLPFECAAPHWSSPASRRAQYLHCLRLTFLFRQRSGDARLAKVVWVPRDGLSITVKDGVVDLNGVVLEERERERSASSPKMSRASKPSRITSSGSNPSPGSSSVPGRTSGAHPNTQGGNNADASTRLHRRVGVFGRSSDRGCSPIRAKRLDARLAANRPAREASLR